MHTSYTLVLKSGVTGEGLTLKSSLMYAIYSTRPSVQS